MRVEIDKNALFALASDTRIEILRSLQPMRRTVTQLAETLSIDKAAVHRHLKKLEEGGFVTRYEDHGFVYYGLSWKARDILSPNDNTRIIVLLSSSWLLMLIVAFLLIAAANSMVGYPSGMNQMETGSPTMYDNATYWRDTTEGLHQIVPLPWYVWAIPGFAIATIASIITIIGIRIMFKPKQRKPSVPASITDRHLDDD